MSQCEPFDNRQFRAALGLFPTGVIVLTAETPSGELLGMTMTSFNSVSLEPPLVLFSIHRQSLSLSKFRTCSRMAINVLGEEQEHLSSRFALARGAKWEGLAPRWGRCGAPLLEDSLVSFECEPFARYDGGDHEIFVVRVLNIRAGPVERSGPILFYDGRYRCLAREQAARPREIEAT